MLINVPSNATPRSDGLSARCVHRRAFRFSRKPLAQQASHCIARLIPAPAPLDREDLRLSVRVEEDWEHAQMLLDALEPDRLDWQGISSLLERQPELRQRMALLNMAENGKGSP